VCASAITEKQLQKFNVSIKARTEKDQYERAPRDIPKIL
jgi:hypothetical protein